MIVKTRWIPKPFSAITVWPFIFILPEAASDPGLLAHEQLHYRRMAWQTPVWWLRYLLWPGFRVQEELLAYRISMQYGMSLLDAANWLCQYHSGLSLFRAIYLLKYNSEPKGLKLL